MKANGHDAHSPLVRGRPRVQSSPTAPHNPIKYGHFRSARSSHRASERRTTTEHADTFGTFASQRVHRPFPWTVFLTCLIAGIIMAAAVKGASGSTTVEAKVRFLSWCLQTHSLPICEHAWQPTNWLNVYKKPIEERRRKDAERLEAEPHWPNAAREWVPAVRPPIDLFRG